MSERFLATSERQRESFQDLRVRIHDRIDKETQQRLKENPHPDEEELACHAFREMIESQVREAVFELRRRGYSCESSGFGGKDGSVQSLDGFFVVDAESKERLEKLGVNVEEGKDGSAAYTWITWKPASADEQVIKKKWNHIVQTITDQGAPAPPSINGDPEEFIAKYAADRTDITKKILERRMALVSDQTDPVVVEQWKEQLERL